jgi:hypothetical protein
VAVEVTPLGFKKPNGKELVRNMDNIISDNAQKAEDILADTRQQLAVVQAGTTGTAIIEDTQNPGFYIFEPSGQITADPLNVGLYTITGA